MRTPNLVLVQCLRVVRGREKERERERERERDDNDDDDGDNEGVVVNNRDVAIYCLKGL